MPKHVEFEYAFEFTLDLAPEKEFLKFPISLESQQSHLKLNSIEVLSHYELPLVKVKSETVVLQVL